MRKRNLRRKPLIGVLLLLLVPAARPLLASQAPGGQSNRPGGQEQDSGNGKKGGRKNGKKSQGKGNGDGSANQVGAAFSEEIAIQLLKDVGEGLKGHDSRRLLSAFDAQKMADYPAFRDQIDALFEKYEQFRVHYTVVQTGMEGSRGIVLTAWEIEEVPADGLTPPLARRGQVRFEMERGPKGWKIVDFSPRGMFS